MDTRRTLPRTKPKPERAYSPWVPLDYVLDRLEEEGLLFQSPWGKKQNPRTVLEEFLGWFIQGRLQVGKDANGNLIARMPLDR